MNPLLIETIARMHREELLREAEQYRLLKSFSKHRPARLMQFVKLIVQALKTTGSKTGMNNSPQKAGAAEC